MVIDTRAITLTGRDAMEIPLSNIEEVVIRPRTDPFVAVVRLIEPPRDIALELGRLSLDPASFAAALQARRPSITLSNSTPGVFASGGIIAQLSEGDKRDLG